MAEPVAAVLFDLDDTLVTYRRSGAELLSLGFEAAGVEPFFDVEEYHRRYAERLGSFDAIDPFREALFAEIAAERGRDPSIGREVARVYARERDQGDVDLLGAAGEVVEALAGEYALGLVTNGPPGMQREKLAATGLADAFDATVFAGFDTAPKPEPEPFEAALGELGVPAERAVHVGNSVRSDVAGARAAGVGAIWLRADGVDPDPEPDHAIDGLAELLDPPWE